MSDPPPSTLEWLLGGGGLLGLGGGIKWAYDQFTKRADKRDADLDAREKALDARESESVQKMEQRMATLEAMVAANGEELQKHRVAIHVLVLKVARDDPAAPELKQVADILGAAFPVPLHTPPDMTETLNRLD